MAEPTTLTPVTGVPALRARGVWPTLRRRPAFWVPTAVLVVLVVVALAPGWVAGFFGNGDPRVCDLSRTVGSATDGHPFGFDVQGCDVYANVVHGTRNSLLVGFAGTILALLIALVVGTGLWTDGKSIAGALIVIGGLGMAVGGGLTVLGLRR